MNQAEISWRDAETSRDQGDWDSADQLFRRALASGAAPAIRVAYGAFLAERQAFRRAIEEFMRGLDGAQASGDLELQAVALRNLAAIYRQLGDYDLARRFQRQVLAIQGEADAGDLLDWSADALLAGKTKIAESLARTALSLVEELEDRGVQADAHGVLGAIAARQGRHRHAISFLIRAARGHRLVDDPQGLGTDYANLAEVCGLIKRAKWRSTFLAAASKCFRRAGMPLSAQRMKQRAHDARTGEDHDDIDHRWN